MFVAKLNYLKKPGISNEEGDRIWRIEVGFCIFSGGGGFSRSLMIKVMINEKVLTADLPLHDLIFISSMTEL